jgi:hypothetical protein
MRDNYNNNNSKRLLLTPALTHPIVAVVTAIAVKELREK